MRGFRQWRGASNQVIMECHGKTIAIPGLAHRLEPPGHLLSIAMLAAWTDF